MTPRDDERIDYRNDIFRYDTSLGLDDFLNEYAKQGWELHSISLITDASGKLSGALCVFQRLVLYTDAQRQRDMYEEMEERRRDYGK
jgi:hypothetical protein